MFKPLREMHEPKRTRLPTGNVRWIGEETGVGAQKLFEIDPRCLSLPLLLFLAFVPLLHHSTGAARFPIFRWGLHESIKIGGEERVRLDERFERGKLRIQAARSEG